MFGTAIASRIGESRTEIFAPSRMSMVPRSLSMHALVLVLATGIGWPVAGQQLPSTPAEEAAEPAEIRAAEQIEVQPQSSDSEIAERLQQVLVATGWFRSVTVRVDSGVAFVEGVTSENRYREWAEETALRTTDVVAVVNRIELAPRSVWDLSPAAESLRQLGRETVQFLPLLAVGALIVLAFLALAKLIRRYVSHVTSRRMESVLLAQVVANSAAILIIILGIYVALRVSGLTWVAMTVLGGTGLIGLALGFAFRDIAENYLSSILISLNRPFRIHDFIEVAGITGYVQRVTTRGTTLMTLDGNHVQIPNSTVYKETITNFTANRKMRQTFIVGISFDDSISQAQEVIFRTMNGHDAVLAEPPPSVLVERLGSATVNLQCILWVDTQVHSALKVKSAVIRQVKRALMTAGISMPDEAREIIFPNGVPVQMLSPAENRRLPAADAPRTALPAGTPGIGRSDAATALEAAGESRPEPLPEEPQSTTAEGQLETEAIELERQASESTPPDTSANLIPDEPPRRH